jgi:2-keto-4-pentenoate hydratase/2-oxohepta-3-ene-1,7-dioic acid hydratase in catechol pathway
MIRRFARLEDASGRRSWVELDDDGAWSLTDAPWHGGTRAGRVDGIDGEGRGAGHRRLAPVAPSKIVCVGRNYRDHAAEMKAEVPVEPLLFLKPPSALLGPDGAIVLPPVTVTARVEHEVELAVVIGRRARHLDAASAADAIFGYTIAGDITARDLQKKDGQWTRAKGFDTFCPVGPVVARGLDASALKVRCTVGGTVRQDGSTADMVFSPAALVAHASGVMTLEPGDLLLTGTPAGVGPLSAGDRVVFSIAGIGALELAVAGSHG